MTASKPLFSYVSTRSMKLNGVDYQQGDPIESSGLSLSRIRQLVDTRKIVAANSLDLSGQPEGDEVRAPELEALPGATVQVTESTVQAEGDPQEGAISGLTAIHRGFGRHDVLKDGAVIESGANKARLTELGL